MSHGFDKKRAAAKIFEDGDEEQKPSSNKKISRRDNDDDNEPPPFEISDSRGHPYIHWAEMHKWGATHAKRVAHVLREAKCGKGMKVIGKNGNKTDPTLGTNQNGHVQFICLCAGVGFHKSSSGGKFRSYITGQQEEPGVGVDDVTHKMAGAGINGK
jgi:hypothetical protein